MGLPINNYTGYNLSYTANPLLADCHPNESGSSSGLMLEQGLPHSIANASELVSLSIICREEIEGLATHSRSSSSSGNLYESSIPFPGYAMQAEQGKTIHEVPQPKQFVSGRNARPRKRAVRLADESRGYLFGSEHKRSRLTLPHLDLNILAGVALSGTQTRLGYPEPLPCSMPATRVSRRIRRTKVDIKMATIKSKNLDAYGLMHLFKNKLPNIDYSLISNKEFECLMTASINKTLTTLFGLKKNRIFLKINKLYDTILYIYLTAGNLTQPLPEHNMSLEIQKSTYWKNIKTKILRSSTDNRLEGNDDYVIRSFRFPSDLKRYSIIKSITNHDSSGRALLEFFGKILENGLREQLLGVDPDTVQITGEKQEYLHSGKSINKFLGQQIDTYVCYSIQSQVGRVVLTES